MLRKNKFAIPVRLMTKAPMVPVMFSTWHIKSSCTPVQNRNWSMVTIDIDGKDQAGEYVSFNVTLRTSYTDKQLKNRLIKSSGAYILNMELYVVDEFGDCKRIPRTHANEYGNGYDPGSHYRYLRINGFALVKKK